MLQITMAFLQGLGIRYLNSSKDNTHLGKTFEGYAHFCRKQPESYIYILGKQKSRLTTIIFICGHRPVPEGRTSCSWIWKQINPHSGNPTNQITSPSTGTRV